MIKLFLDREIYGNNCQNSPKKMNGNLLQKEKD